MVTRHVSPIIQTQKKNKSELTSPKPLTIQPPISKNRTLRTPVKTRSKSKYQFDQDEEDADVVDENEVTLVEEVGGSPTNVIFDQDEEDEDVVDENEVTLEVDQVEEVGGSHTDEEDE